MTTLGAEPCSLDATLHYSWDFAQCEHYPHHAMQVGPICFATPRKRHVFGMCAVGTGSFHPIFTKLSQKFYLDDLKAKFEHGSCQIKN
ncbi:hypothetical protein DPMN_059009 [Dreissena polymorpha]|uniref:Uncharacterized protein n=1 Tax=Dreissena polymorpha TaxID=45954 RepID=A0A9D4C2S8_DREPO|nr:hypothetical protein DPMN_059009 [Dreissena polymorpha]